MKKYIIILFVLSLGLSSCEDIIDKEPLDSVSEKIAFESANDFNAALNGVYSILAKSYGGYNHFMCLEIPTALSDNAELTANGRSAFSSRNVYDVAYKPVQSVFQSNMVWNETYSAIVRANIIIRNIKDFKDISDEEKNNILGEALALRGMLHFDLVRFYGRDYHYEKTALGVPYIYGVSRDKVSRNSVEEVYKNAIDDLLEAEKLLENSTNNYSRISQTTVQAILTRLYLTKRDYDNCVTYADKVINSGKYELLSGADFNKIWNDEDKDIKGEVIFKIRFTEADKVNPMNGGIFDAPFTGKIFHLANDFIALYDQTNDIRFASYYVEDPDNAGKYAVNKYPGRSELVESQYYPVKANDMKLYRLSEIYLSKAEAIVKGGKGTNADALKALNAVRTKRGLAEGNETDAALETAIYNERRKELAFEGIRYYDIKRLNQALVRNSETILIANDYRFAFPLPQEELDRNKNLKQNKDY